MKQYIVCYSGNKWYFLNLEDGSFKENVIINPQDKYITFQVSDFIRLLKSEKKSYVPEIIDFESLDKQFSQTGKDILGESKWHILKTLRRYEVINENYKIESIEDFMLKLNILYEQIISSSDEEFERFNELEKKINKIIYETELRGIKINFQLVEERCEELNRYIYKLKNTFQFEHNIFTPEEKETQFNYIKSKNYKILNSVSNTISLRRKDDKVCDLFYELIRTKKDLKSLIFMISQFGGRDYVHPYFIGFGSITSRIILKEPSLQNLRKENRDIIIPEKDKTLLYIDYSQFEAGILAHVSNDQKLITLYNEGDIYSDIVLKVMNKDTQDDENRKEAKILFYRYLYGDDFSGDKTGIGKKIVKYFEQFTSLTKFKNVLIEKSKKEGIVTSSIKGNHRKLINQNENIWILSHYIQSIASFVFKKALVDVYEKVKGAKLLIPLHDGALYEIDKNKNQHQEIQDEINECFINNLKLVCKSLNATAEIKDFHAYAALI